MRTRCGTILVAVVALAVGGVAGWLAAGAWAKSKCENVEVCKCGNVKECKCENVETANDGRARSPSAPNGRARRPATADSKPRRKALIRSSADAEVQKRILENKISYLEKCIAAAKGGDAKPVENKRETNAEIVERLMKLPTENERWTALMRLDRKTNMSFTLGEMKRLCPEHTELALSEPPGWRDKMTEVAARRIGILDAFDPSGLNEEERKVHTEFMEFLAEGPEAFVNMIDQNDSMTMGEVWECIEKVVSTLKRGAELVKKEREMLISQTVKSFEVPDGDAVELRATLDDVRDVTRFMYFEEKD